MGEEIAFFGEGAFVDEGFFGDAVVGGLVVLEAEVGYLVGERDEEVVGAVVARLVEGAGFADEFGELVDVGLVEGEVFGAVGGEVEVVLGRDFGGEGDFAEPAAGEDGRVDELLEGDGLEAAWTEASVAPSVGSSAVPKCQPSGMVMLGVTMTSEALVCSMSPLSG